MILRSVSKINFVFRAHLAVLWIYPWLCLQRSFLLVFRGTFRVSRIKFATCKASSWTLVLSLGPFLNLLFRSFVFKFANLVLDAFWVNFLSGKRYGYKLIILHWISYYEAKYSQFLHYFYCSPVLGSQISVCEILGQMPPWRKQYSKHKCSSSLIFSAIQILYESNCI